MLSAIEDICPDVDCIGDISGYTDSTYITFVAITEARHVDRIIDALCATLVPDEVRVRALLPRSKRLVLEEIATSDNLLDNRARQDLMKMWCLQEWRRYWPLGSKKAVRDLGTEQMTAMMLDILRPEALTVSLVGNTQHVAEAAIKTLERLAGTTSDALAPPSEVSPDLLASRSKLCVRYHSSDEVYFLVAFPLVCKSPVDFICAEVVRAALVECKRTGLASRIVLQEGMAYDFQSCHITLSSFGYLDMHGCVAQTNAVRVLQLILEYCVEKYRSGLTADEVKGGKARLRAEVLAAHDSPAQALFIFNQRWSLGNLDDPLALIDALALDEVNDRVASMFRFPPALVVYSREVRKTKTAIRTLLLETSTRWACGPCWPASANGAVTVA